MPLFVSTIGVGAPRFSEASFSPTREERRVNQVASIDKREYDYDCFCLFFSGSASCFIRQGFERPCVSLGIFDSRRQVSSRIFRLATPKSLFIFLAPLCVYRIGAAGGAGGDYSRPQKKARKKTRCVCVCADPMPEKKFTAIQCQRWACLLILPLTAAVQSVSSVTCELLSLAACLLWYPHPPSPPLGAASIE